MENPQREMASSRSAPGFSVLLKRNCSISPSALGAVFALITAVTLGIGIGFAALGAWLVLPFAGLEIAALGLAFLANGRHATDYERIALARGRLTVEVAENGRTVRHEMQARGARLQMAREGWVLRLRLRAQGGELEIGRHLNEAARAAFAAELARRLGIEAGRNSDGKTFGT